MVASRTWNPHGVLLERTDLILLPQGGREPGGTASWLIDSIRLSGMRDHQNLDSPEMGG